MRIAFMGSGAIGGYLGARLAQAGQDVTFIARGAHLEAMRSHGLQLESPLGNINLRQVTATETPRDIGYVDVVIFAVKLYDSEKAAAAIVPMVGQGTRVVTLQNGIDSVETLARFVPPLQVVGGAAYISGYLKQPGVIVHVGGATQFHIGGRNDPIIGALQTACTQAGGIGLQTVEDIDQVLWTKFVTLCAFSGATSLIRAGIGSILTDPESRIFLDQLRDEGMAVASAAGHPMQDGYEAHAQSLWQNLPPDTLSSRANDLLQGRSLELAWLSGGRMHALGNELGVPTPAHTAVSRAAFIRKGHRTLTARRTLFWGGKLMKTDQSLVESAPSISTDDAQAMFNKHLATYRKIVGENLMFHHEVYGLLHNLLSQEMLKPFKFLDVACGDAVASAAALKGSAIDHYYGIDLSLQSLELAREALKSLLCPVDLRCCDFVEAMADWSDSVDVVWIGMSLHHLQSEGKVRLMKNVHDTLTRSGLFLIWEPTLLEGENRAEWLDRFSTYRIVCAAITDEEFAAMEAHMRLADFPESADTRKAMGRQAGFSHAEQIFLMPNRFGRVFQFWN